MHYKFCKSVCGSSYIVKIKSQDEFQECKVYPSTLFRDTIDRKKRREEKEETREESETKVI